MRAWRICLAAVLTITPLWFIAVDEHPEHRAVFALFGMILTIYGLALAQDDGRVRRTER